MRCLQEVLSNPCTYLRLLVCTVSALTLVGYILTSDDVSAWIRLALGKTTYDSRRHKMPTLLRDSARATESNAKLRQPTVTIAQSPSSSTFRDDFMTTPGMTTATGLLTFPPLRSPKKYARSAYMGRSRLGNSMFEYISSYVTAMRLGLKFVVMPDGKQRQAYQQMSSLFRTTAPLHSGSFPVDANVSERGWGIYTSAITKLESYGTYTQIIGWLQSWRYIEGCEQFVREEFGLTDRYKLFVNNFFTKNGIHRTVGDQKRATLIAVHVRRGDMLAMKDHYRMASVQYLVQAMVYFRNKYAAKQLTFVVASNDKPWTRAIVDSVQQNYSASAIYVNGTAEEDMAVLSSCDHAIITGGTYAWWAAWLTGGNVMYFRDFIWNGSIVWSDYNADDYYPPSWIGRS